MWFKALAVTFLVMAAIPCEASLKKDCESSKSPAVAIAACTELLRSKTLFKSRRSEILMNRGGALLETRNYHRALDDFNAAIKLAPNDVGNYGLRALAKAFLREDDSA